MSTEWGCGGVETRDYDLGRVCDSRLLMDSVSAM